MSQLQQSLKERHVAMIALGGVIGAGLFVGSSAVISITGPAAILCYIIAGVIVGLIMKMISDMVILYPELGAFTEHIRFHLGDWAGSITGWLYWYFWVIVVAVEALAGAMIISTWVTVYPTLLAILLIMILLMTNLLSAKAFGEFEFWFAAIKVAAIVAFIAFGVFFILSNGEARQNVTLNLVGDAGFMPFGLKSVLAGVTSVMFSVCGSEITTIASAESSSSSRSTAMLIRQVVLRICLFYVASISVILAIVPWRSMVPGISPFLVTLNATGVQGGYLITSFIVLMAVLSCLNSGLYVTSRVMFLLASAGHAPRMFGRIEGFDVPSRSIILAGFISVLIVGVSGFFPKVAFTTLVSASGAVMLFVYFFVALAYSKLVFKTKKDSERGSQRLLPTWLCLIVLLVIPSILGSMATIPGLLLQLIATTFSFCVIAISYLAVSWLRRSG